MLGKHWTGLFFMPLPPEGVVSKIQLDLGYPAISYPDISIIRPWSCSIYCLFSTKVLLKKEKVVKYLFYFIVYPFYMNDNLLQIE